jgi:hypothetical protein
MDAESRPTDPELVKLNPRHARRERRARQLEDLDAFRTVRRVADQDLREMERVAPASREVAALRAALEAATTAEAVVEVEPLVRRTRFALGVEVPDDRLVQIAERYVSWADVGGSYAGVAAASRAADVGGSPDQRHIDVTGARWDDQGRGYGAPSGGP